MAAPSYRLDLAARAEDEGLLAPRARAKRNEREGGRETWRGATIDHKRDPPELHEESTRGGKQDGAEAQDPPQQGYP